MQTFRPVYSQRIHFANPRIQKQFHVCKIRLLDLKNIRKIIYFASDDLNLLKFWKLEFQRAYLPLGRFTVPMLALFFYTWIFMIIRNVWTFSDISSRLDYDFQNIRDDRNISRLSHIFEAIQICCQILGVSDSITGFDRESCFCFLHQSSRVKFKIS